MHLSLIFYYKALYKGVFFLFLIFIKQSCAIGQQISFDPNYTPVQSGNLIQDKDFYFFTLLQNISLIKNQIKSDEYLNMSLKNSLSLVKKASNECKGVPCMVAPFKWSEQEIKSIGDRLVLSFNDNRTVLKLLIKNMRSSGFFIRYKELSDTSLIRKTWEDATKNLNYIIDAYALDRDFLYPKIDSPTFNTKSEDYLNLIRQTLLLINHPANKIEEFFEPSLLFSMYLLQVNYRDEASRFEPLKTTNRLPYDEFSHVSWEKYPFSFILIPGEGPEDNKPISPLGMYRCIIGAKEFFRGRAPFIVVSGGFVHPFQTPYCEAFEMKKFLIEKLKVPPAAIIMEPHARHTTTNIRNTNRIIYKYRIPTSKKILCATTSEQLQYILSQDFRQRCIDLMGYVPWNDMKQIDDFTLSFYPTQSSLQLDASDPLDP